MSLTRLALRAAAPVPGVEGFSRYLFVGPHPDDIEIGAGATVSRLTAMGKKVTFLICTDGRFGDGCTGLRGEEIPLLARILAVADFTDRHRRWDETDAEIAAALTARAGTEFDPVCVEAMKTLLQ